MQVGATADTPEDFVPFTYTEGIGGLGVGGEIWLPHEGACGHMLGPAVAVQILNEVAAFAVGIEAVRALPPSMVPVDIDAITDHCRIDGQFQPGAVIDYTTGALDTISLTVGALVDGSQPEVGTWAERTYPLSWTCSLDI